jgi:hypothetical protein
VARRLRPGGALELSLTITVTALVAAGWAFGAILQNVFAHDELELVDRPVALFFVRHWEAWLTRLMQDLANLGSIRILPPHEQESVRPGVRFPFSTHSSLSGASK